MADRPVEPSARPGKDQDRALCRMSAASHEGRRLLVYATVTRNRPLLIGYDGWAEAGHAIDVAAALLKPTQAVVLSVAPRLTAGESFVTVGSPVSGDAAFEGLNKADAARRAEAGARLARAAGLHADARVCTAAPRWQGIVETAREVDAAVIVLGAKRRRDFSHEVAQHGGRPLLIVPQHARAQVGEGTILIAFDGSEHARRALEAAHALVRRREAVIVGAAPTYAHPHAEAGVDFAQALGLDASARTAAAPATWRAVTDVADEIDASLIVVGSRGLTGAREVVEDSVSRDIARHADRPVLLVPPYSAT